jgi:hypothetical protein
MRSVPAAFLVATILAVPVTPRSACAWGREGHEIICEIAFRELNATAKAKVIELLRKDKRYYRIFARACNYADDSDGDQHDRRTEHYVNVPRYWRSIRNGHCLFADRCLFTAIRQDSGVLESSQSMLEERRRALKYLGHWVGDLHQPLHVSFEDDRGGNAVLLKEEIGCARNLHAVWDTCIPRDVMSDEGFSRNPKGLAEKLHGEISDDDRAKWWRGGIDLVAWANESLTIARQPNVRYCVLEEDGGSCRYSESDDVYDRRAVDRQREIRLTEQYEDDQKSCVRERFKQAGVRLGKMLNQILAE